MQTDQVTGLSSLQRASIAAAAALMMLVFSALTCQLLQVGQDMRGALSMASMSLLLLCVATLVQDLLASAVAHAVRRSRAAPAWNRNSVSA